MKGKEKKRRSSLLSNLPVMLKFIFMDIMLIAAVTLVWTSMLRSVKLTQREKYKQMENTAINATADVMNLTVETAVSIAKSIYTNGNIYTFLNTEYASASEYYSVYYPLQENTALNIADSNVIRSCIIYTSNQTVLTGGQIRKLSDAKDQFWYTYFVKTKKPTVLCIDPDTSNIILVRKLDYQNLKTGESYICMYIEPSALSTFADDFGFDGELYVMSGGKLIYSSNKDASSAEDIVIGPDFECIQRNYYTTEIEFYSCSAKMGLKDFVSENVGVLVCLLAVTLAALIVSMVMAANMKRRIRGAVREYVSTGRMSSLTEKNSGRDEVGQLLEACGRMSEQLETAGSEFKQHSDSLVRKSGEFDSLFATAMRLDAELTVSERLPDLKSYNSEEYFPLAFEAELLKKTALKFGGAYSGSVGDTDIKVPAYSLVLIAGDAFRELGADSVTVAVTGDRAEIRFEGEKSPRSTDVLKLCAIFEDDSVSSEYAFDRSYRFNPYLRLRHCLGSRAELEINGKNRLRLVIRIKRG
ncbi:MAG: hypothetical protein Q4A05_02315 [Ruminococcus sp.]|nr:hypothetical protein [Ruminococcus sp.]